MTLNPNLEVLADKPITLGVVIHRRTPAPPPTKEQLKQLPRDWPAPDGTPTKAWPACMPEDPASTTKWIGHQGIRALAQGAKLCRKKACFGAGGKGAGGG